MYRLISSLIFILCLAVTGQAEQRLLRISTFGGLNTVSGDFAMKPGEARVAHNIDFGRNVGSITKRYGYDSVSFIAGQDSVVGLYGAYYSDGTQQLMLVADSSNVGYGGVYAAPKGQARFSGLQQFAIWIRVYNNYTYHDTITVNGTPYAVSYESDGSATRFEIGNGLADTINNHTTLGSLVTADYFQVPTIQTLYVEDIFENQSTAMASDTAQDITETITLNTNIKSPFSILAKPSFSMLGDKVFVSIPNARGMVWDGNTSHTFPLAPPGEPDIIPLKAEGPVDGTYMYAFVSIDTIGFSWSGVFSPPIISEGQVLITNFQWVTSDALNPNRDTVYLKIYRTKANPGPLNRLTTFYYTGLTKQFSNGVGDSSIATAEVIDSISDIFLSATDKFTAAPPFRFFIGSNQRKYGSPALISTTTGTGGVLTGIDDIPFGSGDFAGWSWWGTFQDTALNLQSDTSRGFYFKDAGKAIKSYVVALPSVPVNDSDLVINLYRAPVYKEVYDSAKITFGGGIDGWWIFFDTTYVGRMHQVATLSSSDTSFVDSLSWTTLKEHKTYNSLSAPIVDKMFSHQNRMYGIKGDNLYVSRLDSADNWGALSFVSLGRGDGDILTDAWVSRGIIRCMKNNSNFNVFQNSDLEWTRNEVSGYWGDIAPQSHAAGRLGHYYLSDEGVLRENEGQFLERQQAVELISAPLRNFTNLEITTLDDAVGFYFDQKYMICIGDTTYVYDERANAWSTWSMTFSGATLYGTETALGFRPGDSMYFIQSGSSNLYRYGTSETDNGSSFQTRWRSGALLHSEPGYKHVKSVEMAFNSGEDKDTVFVGMYDEADNLVLDIGFSPFPNVLLFDTLSTRYKRITAKPHNGVRYLEIEAITSPIGSNSSAVIDLMDIWYSIGVIPVQN